MSVFPPRGTGRAGALEIAPRGLWRAPDALDASWHYDERRTPHAVLLGRHGQQLLGRSDDRHIITIAGSRSGKSRSVLIPNLRRYRGPAVVIDPKGELAHETAKLRASWGHKVFVLNPFNAMGWGSHGHNPCAELQHSASETLSADAAQLAEALIIKNEKEPHWTDSAKNLLTGLILHAFTINAVQLSIETLRRQLTADAELPTLIRAMARNDALDGAIRNIGQSFLGKYHPGTTPDPSDEMRSILSTAREQTRPLDDLKAVFARHDFRLEDLSASAQPITIYLVLPATRIPTHARWLRLFVTQLLGTLERKPIARNRPPLWLILEEFAALGHMSSIEAAAGYFAGFGVRLWTVLQDLTQIKTHYRNSWETFLGNAGIIQAFGNIDATTTRYLSDLLGQTTIIEEQDNFVSVAQRDRGDMGVRRNLRAVPLLSPSEITLHFARSTGRQLILVPGERPVHMNRLALTESPL